MKPLPQYSVANRWLSMSRDDETSTWPWPFPVGDDYGPAYRARWQRDQVSKQDLLELAGISDCYSTLITHPSRSMRDTLNVLHRIWKEQCK